VVTSLAPAGDAWACTNPSAGRGMSLGLMQAQVLRQVTAAHLDDPATLARVYVLRTEREVAPYYRNQVRADRQRVAEMAAIHEGREPPARDPTTVRFLAAARTDADALRALLETVQCLALPHEVLARPAVECALAAVGDDPPPPFPGPRPRGAAPPAGRVRKGADRPLPAAVPLRCDARALPQPGTDAMQTPLTPSPTGSRERTPEPRSRWPTYCDGRPDVVLLMVDAPRAQRRLLPDRAGPRRRGRPHRGLHRLAARARLVVRRERRGRRRVADLTGDGTLDLSCSDSTAPDGPPKYSDAC
jgi:hypothetical protein